MWRKLSKKEQQKYLDKWIKEIVADKKNTLRSVKRHIARHAKHIFDRDPKLWAASMRNLTEIFEGIHKIETSVNIRLERLENKYKKNPNRYNPPPKF